MPAADIADVAQKFINSPPGQLAAGATLAGFAWKLFERVEAVLTDQAKFEIAVWLVGIDAEAKLKPWPDTLAGVFDRVFGRKYFSWKSFVRSVCLSVLCFSLTMMVLAWISSIKEVFNGLGDFLQSYRGDNDPMFGRLPIDEIRGAASALWILAVWLGVDYASLLKTRFALRLIGGRAPFLISLIVLPVDLVATVLMVLYASLAVNVYLVPNLVAASATLIWLWLYVMSGFILKAARRFDIGFQWFNRKFDIEKKPLQAIGLVAGSIVAIVYWGFVLALHALQK